MIPLSIQATNFGVIPYAEVDLTNITLAAICGVNGAGKSTMFTIAPLFALFGVTKNGCSVDDMVRAGQSEMSVTLEFEHRGEIYRVIRTRSLKGRGKSSLELQKRIDARWTSESGATIRETEEKIKALLNLDADTFTTSSMILQGKANEFTSKSPGQRKAILAQILGLDIYEKLQDKSREKARAVTMELEKVKAKLADIDERIKELPGYKNKIKDINESIVKVTAELKQKEHILQSHEDDLKNLQIIELKVQDIDKNVADINTAIAKLNMEKNSLIGKQAKAQKMLEAEEKIKAKAAEYEHLKQQSIVLQAKQPRLAEVSKERDTLNKEIQDLNTQMDEINKKIVGLEKLLNNRSKYEKAAKDHQKVLEEIEVMDKLYQQKNVIDKKVQLAKNEYEKKDIEIKVQVKELKDEFNRLSKKAEMLENSDCIDPLKARCKFLIDAREAKEQLPHIEAQLKSFDGSQIQPYWEKYQAVKKELENLKYDAEKHKSLKALEVELRSMAQVAAEIEARADMLQSLKEQKNKLIQQKDKNSQRLENLQQQVVALENELQPLHLILARLPKLQQWAQAKEELPVARQLLVTTKERLETIRADIKDKTSELSKLEDEKKAYIKDFNRMDSVKAAIASCNKELEKLHSTEKELYGAEGSIRAKIESLTKDEAKKKELLTELEPLAKRLTRFETLIKAFGRDGIPALIIENAIPELERIANEILGQMTNGKHTIRFETQRDLKSKAGMAETLDIIIGDWLGERPYETYSGGEQLRIDFAIRFALAELLARRAGSKVEWLTIDEGLGSQDEEHRTLVLEAIKAVANRFKKVLVITHIGEAQAAFDQTIYFEPTEGSIDITVAA